MPTYRITSPDGQTFDVKAPEGATEQEVMDYVRSQTAQTQETQPVEAPVAQAPQGAPVSRTERFFRGVADPVVGASQLVANMLPEALRGQFEASPQGFLQFNTQTGQTQLDPAQMNAQIAESEREFQARRGTDGLDGWRLLGNIAGTAPLAAFTPGAGATLGATAVRSGATGGLTALTQPVTDDSQPFFEQKGEQAAIGTATGFFAGPLFQSIGRMFSPRVDPGVQYLQQRGVTPRPGQIIGPAAAAAEDKAMSLPIVGDKIAEAQRRTVEQFNRAAYNEVLKPLGKKFSGPVGREGIAEVQDVVGKAYDDLLPNLRWKADQKFVSEVGKIASMAQSLPPDKKTQFQRIMANELLPRIQGGTMDGLSFKQMESELGRIGRTYASSSSADDRVLADGIKEVLSSARSALERSNPQSAGELKKINQAFATFTRVQDAASRVGTEEGIFTPNHLLSAVRQQDRSVRKGAFARGDALLQQLAETGKRVIGVKYPDSGTAGRLANVGAGAALVMNPALTIGGGLAGSLPYTQTGQNVAAALLTQRPSWAQPIGSAIERASVPAGGVLGAFGGGAFLAPEQQR